MGKGFDAVLAGMHFYYLEMAVQIKHRQGNSCEDDRESTLKTLMKKYEIQKKS
jgi:hypothetical protein